MNMENAKRENSNDSVQISHWYRPEASLNVFRKVGLFMVRHRTPYRLSSSWFLLALAAVVAADYHNRFTRSHIKDTMYYLKAFKVTVFGWFRTNLMGTYQYRSMYTPTKSHTVLMKCWYIICCTFFGLSLFVSTMIGHHSSLPFDLYKQIASFQFKLCESEIHWATSIPNGIPNNRLKFDQIRSEIWPEKSR